jgi:hypothetical protein
LFFLYFYSLFAYKYFFNNFSFKGWRCHFLSFPLFLL